MDINKEMVVTKWIKNLMLTKWINLIIQKD